MKILTPYLDQISQPSDLKKLREKELGRLAEECRARIIDTVSRNGGHLASNLGVVELTLCLAHCFDFREKGDCLIFDVGHQSYTWKLISGRQNSFDSLRKKDGLSGFPKREESPFDCFNTGHSSTAISAALGLARGDRLRGVKRRHIALVGDGALSGGMSFEALNDAGSGKEALLVIVNDNTMSIDENVGGLSLHLERLRISSGYRRMKHQVEKNLRKRHFLSGSILRNLAAVKARLRTFLRPSGVYFEELGFRYYGPVDGHDIHSLIDHLEAVKDMDVPVVLHVLTRKGHGYRFAEEAPGRFHGVAPFVVETGEAARRSGGQSFTAEAGRGLCALAEKDPGICAITAAMTSGCGLNDFAEKFPERFFDTGIAEQHAVSFGAGLAVAGMKPFVSLYSTFSQRAVDQLLHDVCLQNLPLTLLLDHGGLVGSDGETHQGIYDIALFQGFPNLKLLSPADGPDLRACLSFAAAAEGPVAIRYPKEALPPPLDLPEIRSILEPRCLRRGRDLCIVALGALSSEAVKAAEILHKDNIEASIFSCVYSNAEAFSAIIETCQASGKLLIAEDGIRRSGFAAYLASVVQAELPSVRFLFCGIENPLRGQASRGELLAEEKLDAEGLAVRARAFLEETEGKVERE